MEISREKAYEVIKGQKNRIFGATFKKKDGTTRKMIARLGVKAYLSGGENKVVKPENSYITVFDMQKQEYRTLNLRTLKELKVSGKRIIVK